MEIFFVFISFLIMKKQHSAVPAPSEPPKLQIDLTDPDEARKAFIMSEVFNRKY